MYIVIYSTNMYTYFMIYIYNEHIIYIYHYIYTVHRFFWMGCSQQPDFSPAGFKDASRASDPWADRGRSGLHRGIGLFEGSAASTGGTTGITMVNNMA